MRTLFLAGIASIAALTAVPALANHGSETTRVERRVIVVDGASTGDEAVYRSGDDRVLAESDYRGRWQGEWTGTWEDSEGRQYNGTYEGAYDGARGADYDAPPPAPVRARHQERREVRRDARHDASRYDERRADSRRYDDRELSRLCRRDDGVGGAAIGGVVGGVAGNRIAGRGNRSAGTLLGAAGGAIVGAVIDRAEDGQCRDYWNRTGRGDGYSSDGYRYDGEQRYDDRYAYRGDYGARGDSYGYEGGYYESSSSGSYYGGGVTTIVIPGAPTIIEETETTYETVTVAAPRARVAPRRAHRRAPVRRPRCVCR